MDPGPLVDDPDLFRFDHPLVELYSVVIASWGHDAQLLSEVKPLQRVGQLPSGRPRALRDGVVVEGDSSCGKQKSIFIQSEQCGYFAEDLRSFVPVF